MPVVEEPLPPVATVPVISPVTHPAIIEAEKPNPIDILLGWINMGGGLQNTVVVPTVPVQVDGSCPNKPHRLHLRKQPLW